MAEQNNINKNPIKGSLAGKTFSNLNEANFAGRKFTEKGGDFQRAVFEVFADFTDAKFECQTVDFTNAVFLAGVTFEKARRIVEFQAAGKTPDEINTEARALVVKANEWLEENNKKYQRQLHRYDEMSIAYPIIEMVRKGIVKIDPLRQSYIGEKGVDVALAVSMIKFHEKCDKLILVSGDLDYAEAIQFVKDNMKKVYLVRLCSGHPPVNKSVSRTLMALADKVVDLYETEIRKIYVK